MEKPKPTKEEVIAKVRKVLSDDEFDIVYDEFSPTPLESHRDRVYFQFAGFLKGFPVWLNRGFQVVVCVGAFGSGRTVIGDACTFISKHAPIAYEKVEHILQVGLENCELMANEFVIFNKPSDWPENDDESVTIYAIYDQTTGTTTTTTTPAPDGSSKPVAKIEPGGGIVATMDSWHGLG